MPTRRTVNVNTSVGNQNISATPKTVGTLVGLAVGDLIVLGIYIAQGLGVTQTVPAPTDMTKVSSDGTSTNRAGGVIYAIVTSGNIGSFANISMTSNSTASRFVSVCEVWTPDAGYHWDASTVACLGPDWIGSAHTSDTWPTDSLGSKTLKLGIAMTNKGANTTLTSHTSDGTDTQQGNSPSAASGSVSDSVLSMSVGGTGTTYNVSQANGQTYLFGISQVADAAPIAMSGTVVATSATTGSITANMSASGVVAAVSTTSLTLDSGSTPMAGTVAAVSSTSGTLGASRRALSGTVAAVATTSGSASVGLPVVTGHGFSSVNDMLAGIGVTFAHRNLSATYPEMTEYGIRMAANLGHGVIEISCQRSSDGVWFGAHDQTPDRVSVLTTYDGTNYNALTWAQIQSLGGINSGTTGAPRPYATLATLLNTLPSDFVFMVDPKQSGGTPAYMTEFLDILDANVGPTRAFIKIDGAATATRFIAAQARGYKTSAYYYAAPATPTPGGNVAANIGYCDIPGLNYDASQADWDVFRAYGKPMWAHVVPDQTGYNTSITRGAQFVQVTSASITPVGLNAKTSLVGAAAAVSGTSGTLQAPAGLSGTVAVVASTSGTITARRVMGGSVAATSAASGTITLNSPASGTVAAVSTTSGSILPASGLSGIVTAISTVSGVMTRNTTLSGVVAAATATSGAINLRQSVGGAVNAVSTTTGILGKVHYLSGTVAAVSAVTGTLRDNTLPPIPSTRRLTGGTRRMVTSTMTNRISTWQRG